MKTALSLITLILLPFAPPALADDLAEPREVPSEDIRQELRKQGQAFYLENCAACHGESGNGKGPAAAAIKSGPKPRDFTVGKFLYGDKPEQIFHTISEGSPGTSMPSWKFMPAETRWALVFFVLSFHKKPSP